MTHTVSRSFAELLSADRGRTPLSPYQSDEEFERLWDAALARVASFPAGLVATLADFRLKGNGCGALLLRGFPVDHAVLGPTPAHFADEVERHEAWRAAEWLLAVSSVLGEVFAFQRQHNGALVQNMVPVEDDAYTQKGTGSRVFLEWHNEDPYDQLRADYIALGCLRSDPAAQTALVYADDVPLAARTVRILAQPRFHVGIDLASGGTGVVEEGPVIAILAHDEAGRRLVRLDTDLVAAAAGDAEADAALTELREALPEAARHVTLEAGDVLIIDNRRTLHGRTAYSPNFDGTDRWLQRVSIAADITLSAPYRTRRPRAIDVEARNFG